MTEDQEKDKILHDFEYSATSGDFKSIFDLADKLKKCEKHDEIYIVECEFCKKNIDAKK